MKESGKRVLTAAKFIEYSSVGRTEIRTVKSIQYFHDLVNPSQCITKRIGLTRSRLLAERVKLAHLKTLPISLTRAKYTWWWEKKSITPENSQANWLNAVNKCEMKENSFIFFSFFFPHRYFMQKYFSFTFHCSNFSSSK